MPVADTVIEAFLNWFISECLTLVVSPTFRPSCSSKHYLAIHVCVAGSVLTQLAENRYCFCELAAECSRREGTFTGPSRRLPNSREAEQ